MAVHPPPYRPEGLADDPYDAAEDAPATVTLPRLGWTGSLRWVWRQLTSMRVALMLLMLLAVVAVPGSVFPQRPRDPASVAAYLRDNPSVGPWLDRLGFFDVYASPWFSAVYVLLFVSLIGCIVPRLRVHLRAVRAAPPRTPRNLARMPSHRELTTTASPEAVVDAARTVLVGRFRLLPRFRVVTPDEVAGVRTVSAERGYVRESGNVLFHLALVGLLVSIATGQALHYRGQAIVVEGRGFANAVTDYDTFEAGTAFDPRSLVPFTLRLDRFTATFTADAAARPRDFVADVTVKDAQGEHKETIKVNHPLSAGAANVYLQGNGYAPDVLIRDADGNIAFSGPVPFLPQDAQYRSKGVIKVPDVTSGDQIGLVGFLLPTAVISAQGASSIYPQPDNPMLVLTVWKGDLGLDDGVPQNVYELDARGMTQVLDTDGKPSTLLVAPGQTVDLPDGLGTLTWSGLPRFVALDLRHDPSLPWILGFAVAALGGLVLSLFTPRRRVWLRVTSVDGRRVVAAAALARGDDLGLDAELDRVVAAVAALEPDPHQEGQDDEPR
ncbi:MAG TPA: cytochrome c biogenesis protein ResB [Actinotalea sp.]